jgi:uncharacterized RDD family membrane protein YckC
VFASPLSLTTGFNLMLDTTRSIETPEGIELALRVAGPIVRAIAWSIDLGIRIIIYIILAILFGQLGEFGKGLLLLSIFFLEWFYPVFFEIYKQGASPGKSTMRIKVLHESGTPVDWSASMIRNLLRAVDFLPFLYGFGLISMIMNKDFKRLGDLAAGTVVVYEDYNSTQLPFSKKKKTDQFPDVTPKAMPIVLPLEEQEAIINFAQRAQHLSKERAIELANLVTPLTGKTEEAGIQTLYQLANGLIGIKQ